MLNLRFTRLASRQTNMSGHFILFCIVVFNRNICNNNHNYRFSSTNDEITEPTNAYRRPSYQI